MCQCAVCCFFQTSVSSYRRIQGDDSDSVVNQSHGQESRALLTRWNISQAHTNHVCRHFLPLCVLIQLSRLETKRETGLLLSHLSPLLWLRHKFLSSILVLVALKSSTFAVYINLVKLIGFDLAVPSYLSLQYS